MTVSKRDQSDREGYSFIDGTDGGRKIWKIVTKKIDRTSLIGYDSGFGCPQIIDNSVSQEQGDSEQRVWYREHS